MPFEMFIQLRIFLLKTEELSPRAAVPNHQLTVRIQRCHVAKFGRETDLFNFVFVKACVENFHKDPGVWLGIQWIEIFRWDAFKNQNTAAAGATHQIIIVLRITQGCDIKIRFSSHFFRVEVFAIEQRLMIDAKDKKILLCWCAAGFAISHCQKCAGVREGDTCAIGDIESSRETIERMIETNFAVG